MKSCNVGEVGGGGGGSGGTCSGGSDGRAGEGVDMKMKTFGIERMNWIWILF